MSNEKKITFNKDNKEHTIIGTTIERYNKIIVTNQYGSVIIPQKNVVSINQNQTKPDSGIDGINKGDNALEVVKTIPNTKLRWFRKFLTD